MGIKISYILVSKREKNGREEEEDEEEEEEEEEEGEKFKQSQIKVWKLTLIMNSMRFGVDDSYLAQT